MNVTDLDSHPSSSAEELERLLADGPAPTDATPGHLAELVRLARQLEDLGQVHPRTAFRTALRAQLMRAAAEHAAPTRDGARAAAAAVTGPAPAPLITRIRAVLQRWRTSTRLAMVTAVSAVMIGGAGMTAAAEQAQPGDLLYGVKQTTEAVRLGLAGDRAAAGNLRLAFAERRLEEVVDGAGTLNPEVLIDTLAAMDRHSIAGAVDLLVVYHRTSDTRALQRLTDFLSHQRRGLRGTLDQLPVEVVPFAHGSLNLVTRIEHEASGVALTGCQTCIQRLEAASSGGPTTRCCAPEATPATGAGQPTPAVSRTPLVDEPPLPTDRPPVAPWPAERAPSAPLPPDSRRGNYPPGPDGKPAGGLPGELPPDLPSDLPTGPPQGEETEPEPDRPGRPTPSPSGQPQALGAAQSLANGLGRILDTLLGV